MSSPESPAPAKKRSPLFGITRTKLLGMDAGVRTTIENSIKRWTEKRIELLEALPEQTRNELDEEGLLLAPPLALANVKPVQPAQYPSHQARPSTGNGSHAAPPPARSVSRDRLG